MSSHPLSSRPQSSRPSSSRSSPSRYCRHEFTLAERLAHRSVRDPRTGCILWTGCRNRYGYGYLTVRCGTPTGSRAATGPAGGGGVLKRETWLAHRAAWTVSNGPVPDGLIVCHRCDVRACINPKHLFVGSYKQNMADWSAKYGKAARRPKPRPANALAAPGPVRADEILRVVFGGEEIVSRVLSVRRVA